MPKAPNKALARDRERAALENKLLSVVNQQYLLALKKRIIEYKLRLLGVEEQIADPSWDKAPAAAKQAVIRHKKHYIITIKKLNEKLHGGDNNGTQGI